jgi:hypothetical protein
MPDNLQSVEDALGRASASVTSLRGETRDTIGLQISEDRSHIVLIVFIIYAGIITATSVFLLYRGLFSSAPLKDIFEDFTEVIKIAVIPVVTLVIGYYFGTTKTDQT